METKGLLTKHMAKKKKHHKKKSQYKSTKKPAVAAVGLQEQNGAHHAPAVAQPVLAADDAKKPDSKRPQSAQDNSDMLVARRARREVVHAMIVAGVIMLGLVALWCLFAFTSVGSEVYRFIRI